MRVAILFSGISLLAAACGGEETDSESQAVIAPVHMTDATTGGTLEYFWLPPEASTQPNLTGTTFNNTFGSRIKIEIADLDCTSFTVGSVVYTFNSVQTVASLQAYRGIASLQTMNMQDHHCYRITPKLDNSALGYRDVIFESSDSAPRPSGVLRWNGTANQVISFTLRNQFDADSDGILNHVDACPSVAGLPNANPAQNGCPLVDNCPSDPSKTDPGHCGCGVPDVDNDGDGNYAGDGSFSASCSDQCDSNATKTVPGHCGCAAPDVDNDGDGNYAGDGSFSASCSDTCDSNATKSGPGICGCASNDVDADGDGNYAGDGSFSVTCSDQCDADNHKSAPGICGCNAYPVDLNEDGTPDTCSTANSCQFAPI